MGVKMGKKRGVYCLNRQYTGVKMGKKRGVCCLNRQYTRVVSCQWLVTSEKIFEKRFGGKEKSCTFAVLQISVDFYIRIYHKK